MTKKKAGAAEPATDETSGAAEGGAAADQAGGEQTAEGWDAEGEHTLAVDRMAKMADDLVLTDKSLVFDVRDFLLDVIKSRPKPWSGTSQAEQRDVAAACEHTAGELVRQIVEKVATHAAEVEPVRVLLTKVALGADIVVTGKVKVFDPDEVDEAVLTLHHAVNAGKFVMLTPAGIDDYKSDGREAETDPDEPGLEFEAGDHPDDDSDLADEPDDDGEFDESEQTEETENA